MSYSVTIWHFPVEGGANHVDGKGETLAEALDAARLTMGQLAAELGEYAGAFVDSAEEIIGDDGEEADSE